MTDDRFGRLPRLLWAKVAAARPLRIYNRYRMSGRYPPVGSPLERLVHEGLLSLAMQDGAQLCCTNRVTKEMPISPFPGWIHGMRTVVGVPRTPHAAVLLLNAQF